ncbi:MAG: hypothetical protein HEEMFOPI_01125 [Holosporales bacterium]
MIKNAPKQKGNSMRFIYLLSICASQILYSEEKTEKSPKEDVTQNKQGTTNSDSRGEALNERALAYEETKRLKEDSENYFFKNSVFKLAPFDISIFYNGQVVSTVQVEAGLQIENEKDWPKIRLKVPKLYNEIFIDLYHSLNFLWDRSNPPSPESLKKRILSVANKTLGEGQIKLVLIGLVAVTPH